MGQAIITNAAQSSNGVLNNSIPQNTQKSTPKSEKNSENISDDGSDSTQTQNRRTVGESDRAVLSRALMDGAVTSDRDYDILKKYREGLDGYKRILITIQYCI